MCFVSFMEGPGKRIWLQDPPGLSWLPALEKFLPDSWCDDSKIADKAVKADDDVVPEHVWHKHIELAISSATNQRGFQLLALIWQRPYMYRQFLSFLTRVHGPNWKSRLSAIQRQTARVATLAIEPPPRKRARGGRIQP
jgi:hypothetical protein